MHAFFVSPEGEISKEEAKHAKSVLRLNVGEEIEALDGTGRRFLAQITSLTENGGRAELLQELASNESAVHITLYQGIPKAEKLELVTQKLTELGICRLVPVRMRYCVVKQDAKDAEKKAGRLQKISLEAVKQCGRARAMEIAPAMDFAPAIEDMRTQELLIIPWENAENTHLKDLYREFPNVHRIGIVIGPEGGMAQEEVEKMLAAGGKTATLGSRILRTETAAIVSCAVAMSLWGDL